MALLRRRHVGAAALLAGLAVLAPSTQAFAAWRATGSGGGTAASTTVPVGPKPSVTVDGRNVTVAWPASTIAGGDAVSGYRVRRVASDGSAATIGASCNTTQSGLSCTETAVAPGAWSYGVTALVGSWTGVEGTRTTATVAAPTFTLSAASAVVGSPGTATGTISGYVGPGTVSFRLDNAVTGRLLTGSPTAIPSGGRVDVSVAVPSGVADGTHKLYAIGSGGDVVAATLVVDATRPTPVTLVTADGGGGTGGIDAGDSLSVTFSEPLLASSLCASWTDDGTAKSLTTGVTVSVANNGSATSTDILTVLAPVCGTGGFHFGSLDLGGKGYVKSGSTATFGATGASSTISWDPATSTLKIVLGGSSTNRFGTVNSSTATYAPDAAITDAHGLPIAGTVAHTGRQF